MHQKGGNSGKHPPPPPAKNIAMTLQQTLQIMENIFRKTTFNECMSYLLVDVSWS